MVDPHEDPSGFGDPTGLGHISPPVDVSGSGRGLEFADQGGDGRRSPGPTRPVAILIGASLPDFLKKKRENNWESHRFITRLTADTDKPT